MDKKQQEFLDKMIQKEAVVPYREKVVERIMALRLQNGDRLEFRLSSKNEHIALLAKRAADAFISTFFLYPTSLATHSANAHVLEASEAIIVADHTAPAHIAATLLGAGLEKRPLRIEADDSLPMETVAVRFEARYEEYMDELQRLLLRVLMGEKP